MLQQLLPVQYKKRYDLLVIGGVCSNQTEIELRTVLVQGHTAHTVCDGTVLLLGKRFRIDDMKHDHSSRLALIFLQQLLYPLCIVADTG